MMALAMVSLLVGMVLGQHFKVLVLMPTMAIALALAIGAGIAGADPVWWIILLATAAATCLQVGYLIGVGIRSRQSKQVAGTLPHLLRPTRHPVH